MRARLHGISRPFLLCLAFATAAAVACGGKSGGGDTTPPPDNTTPPEPVTPEPTPPPDDQQPPPDDQAGPVEPPAGNASGYTNLQVLPATWTKDQVKGFMKDGVSAALGVKCDFCHDVNDFAADSNEHKVIAREMMKMAWKINQEHFPEAAAAGTPRVTCMTCHQGKKEPQKAE